MQDTSSNPYIPQESEAIRQKVYLRQSPLGKVVKWLLISTIVVAILVGGGLFFVVPRTTAVDQDARVKFADILQPPAELLKRVNVQSELGFKLNYDNRIYSSYAEVGDSTAGSDNSAAVASGEIYENNDLRVLRAYNYVRIRPIESIDSARALAPQPPEMELFATVSDEDLTKAAAVPENKGLSRISLFVKLDTDKRLAKKVADDKTIVTINATKPVSTNVGGIDYQKVRYTTTNDNYRIANVKYDDCYYTIQHDQPYSICISDVRPYNVSAASLVEQVFDTITFEEVSTQDKEVPAGTTEEPKKTSFTYPLTRLAQATTTEKDTTGEDAQTIDEPTDAGESPLLTITPAYYSDAASLKSIATTQPSVVRIGMLYCADLTLKFESGEIATNLTDACVGSVSSGVFVSKDGYIATTGHAIRTQKKAVINGYINFAPGQDEKLDRLQRILDYLLKAKIILQSDADYLKTGASTYDQEALAKIENIASVIPDKLITPINEEYTYAIQPSEKPIVISEDAANKPSFAYSDSVIKAKYVASNYDATKSIQIDFKSETPTVDVGLLKAEGNFPDVQVASAEDVKSNDVLNTIGYPAYTDSSLTVDKIRNIPIVTTSTVEQAYQKEGTRLIQTNLPVLPGNDGAPVVDSNGKLIGFAVYGLSYCPDQQCFGNGTVRSISELTKLLDEENLTLNAGSPASTSWNNAVNEFFRANYAASSNAFSLAGGEYAFNRWASPLEKLAVAGEGSTHDTSLMNQLQFIMIVTLIILIVLTILLAIAFVIHRRRINQLRVGHYGTTSNTAAVPGVGPAPTALPPIQPMPQSAFGQPPATTASTAQPTTAMPANQSETPVQSSASPANESPVLQIHESEKTQSSEAPRSSTSAPEQPKSEKPTSGAVEDPFYK